MSLTLSQIKKLAEEIQTVLKGTTCESFFALSSRKFILLLSKQKEIYRLLMCFQEPFLRFHLYTGKIKKTDNSFAQKIDRMLAGDLLKECSLLNDDRILSFSFQEYRLIAEFFPRKPNLYLLDSQDEILASLNPLAEKFYQLPEKPSRISQEEPTSVSHVGIEKYYEGLEKESQFLLQKNQALSHLHKRLKSAQKQLQKRKDQLSKCQDWENVQHEALLLQANLYQIKKGASEIVVTDWEHEGTKRTIFLNPQKEPSQEVARRFRESKKLRIGLDHQQAQIISLQQEIEQYQKQLQILKNLTSQEELNKFCSSLYLESSSNKKMISQPYHEFFTEAGLKIWVGKSAAQNERLTFQMANGSDYWLHVVGYPGSHVVLRRLKGQDPDPESILDAAQLALRYSKAKGEADIYLTQCKYVKRTAQKGSGKVQISQHKILYTIAEEQRWLKIKARCINI